MRKLANNTFTKGLFKDFHPLTVGNDVMTDALNATIVTMNGNEGILQNDMGNGRVESAFLPAGYVPVGMKEYGGIIYVASYNPVTNKGLIGSFPSPERNIDLSETGGPENPLILLDEAYIRLYKYSKFNDTIPLDCQKGIAGLVNKTDIFGKDRYMRAGDKFGFYFDDYDELNQPYGDGINKRPVLSNYYLYDYENNEHYQKDLEDNKIKSKPSGILDRLALWDEKNQVYRNNIITLSTLILDVNNNLRDITELLKRFDKDNKKIDTKYIKSKTDIFNSGYFINESENTNWDPVNIERNKKALNTYNNKLYGKMFLVGKANTLEYIENGTTYTSYSSENGKYIEIVFNVNYFYNCPEDYLYEPILYYFVEPVNGKHVYTDPNHTNEHDTVMNSDPDPDPNNSSNDKKIYGENNQEYFLYDLINEVKTVDYKDKDKEGYDYNNAKVIETYDPITNLYKRTYQIRCKTTFTEGYLHYVIVPRMKNIPGYDNVNNPDKFGNKKISNDTISQLTHLAIEGTIDFSKIGTGFNGMLYWNYRYLETIDGAPYMLLRWGLDDYLLTSDEISDLKMEFFSLNESGNVSISESNSTFEPPTNPDLDDIISDWDRNKLYRDGLGEPMPRRNIRETTPLIPKPSYTLNVSDKYSYTGPFMEYLYLNETELKKRHIYIVKLSRIKNGQYEFLAYRILITTSIYNDLFSGDNAIDDYCADDVANTIYEHNKIEFDLDIIESVKYKTSLDKDGLGEVYEKDSNGQYNKTNKTFKEFIYKSNDDITPPAGESLLVEYYKYTKQSSIEINIHIPDKYPFSINKEKFGFENVQFKQINEYEYDKYPENIKLPILDIINNPKQRASEYRINGSNYTIASDYSTSNNNFTIEDTTYFPSVMIYKYLDNTTKIRPKYLYKNLIEYVLEEINNSGYFPIVGSDGYDDDKGKYVWVDLGWFKLDSDSKMFKIEVYDDDASHNKDIKKENNSTIELYNKLTEKDSTQIYRLFDNSNLNKFLTEKPSSLFKHVHLFASPLIFVDANKYVANYVIDPDFTKNFNDKREHISRFFKNDKLGYVGGHDGTGDCNFFLREKFDDYLSHIGEDNPGNKRDKYFPNYTYWSWAYIVWRGYGDTFVVLNKMLYRNVGGGNTMLWGEGGLNSSGLRGLIEEIFNKLWYIYFRRDNDGTDSIDNNPVEIEVYPFYPIAYNYDYIAKSCTEINVPSITINDDAIYYYLLDENRDLIQRTLKDGTYGQSSYKPKTSLNLTNNQKIDVNLDAKKLLDTYNLHENLLLFEPIKSGIKSNTKLFQFKIPQVQYVNDRSLDIQGLIKHKVENDYMIYIRDVDGYSLSDLFYNVTDGDVVQNTSAMDIEVRDFVEHFTVRDNLMIVRQVVGEATNSNRVYMGCNAEQYRIVVEIGGCQYVELPDWRTIPSLKNYYTLFGNRTAYYASGGGLGGGSRTNSEAAWSGEGGRSEFGQSGGGSRTGNANKQSATDN